MNSQHVSSLHIEEITPHPRSVPLHEITRPTGSSTCFPMIETMVTSPPDRSSPRRTGDSIPALSHDYVFLGSTIRCTKPAEEVMEQISSFLRINSMEYIRQPGRWDCRSAHGLELSIFIWQRRETNEIIVELQRRNGCSILYQRVKRAFLRSLQGYSGETQTMSTNLSLPKCVLFKPLLGTTAEENFVDDISSCSRLLMSEQKDQRQLGMESLCCLTRPSDDLYHISLAQTLLVGDEDHAHILRHAILQLLREMALTMRDSSSSFMYNRYTYSLALQVLANCLDIISRVRDTPPVDFSTSFWQHIKAALRSSLNHFALYPCEVALVTRCIGTLIKITPSAKNLDDTMVSDLINAHKFGQHHNMDLEIETGKLLRLLGVNA